MLPGFLADDLTDINNKFAEKTCEQLLFFAAIAVRLEFHEESSADFDSIREVRIRIQQDLGAPEDEQRNALVCTEHMRWSTVEPPA